MTTTIDLSPVLESVAARARAAGVFASVRVEGNRLECEADGSAAPAFYRLDADADRVWVSMVTPDRWLSGSIESDLMHTGDKIEELIEEEMVELGYAGGALSMEHFRSEDKLFTFRSALPVRTPLDASAAELASLALLGYEAAFRQLGDMEAGDEDED